MCHKSAIRQNFPAVLILMGLATAGLLLFASAVATPVQAGAPPASLRRPLLAPPLVVTSTADSGPGTLREALLTAVTSDTITFDPAVFPPASPVTITLSSELYLSQGDLTLDASNAGVILDGSGIPAGYYRILNVMSNGNVIRGLQIVHSPFDGILIMNANDNIIGGDRGAGAGPLGEGNLVSGNGGHGIQVCGDSANNQILGNFIGTDLAGTTAWANAGSGVALQCGPGPHDNTIGGLTAGTRNLISGNAQFGISLREGAHHNLIQGNRIGTDAAGLAALGNASDGINLNAGFNTIGGVNPTPGGACSGACNLISGNRGNAGVQISGSDGLSNTLAGNYVGTNLSGTAVLSNTSDGIAINGGAQFNRIGGATPAERNLLSGNGRIGLFIASAHFNTVTGNYIGTDVSGQLALGNVMQGIVVNQGSQANDLVKNVVSGEKNAGINLNGAGTLSNTVRGNYVGVTADGLAALPNGGISVNNGASRNVIGGLNTSPAGEACAGDCNLISGDPYEGVGVGGTGTLSNVVTGNWIGLNANGLAIWGSRYRDPRYNVGLSLGSGARYTRIGGSAGGAPGLCTGECNRVSGYTGAGITVNGTALFNTISRNSFYDNGGLGIDLATGGNTELPAPVITAFDLSRGTASGTACLNCQIEVFSDAHGEGRWFEGTATANGSGNWSFSKGSAFTGPDVSATATDAAGNTSEFGQDWPPNPPPAPAFSAPLCGVTNLSQPVLSGFAQMGSLIMLKVDGNPAGQATTSDLDRWSTVPTTTLPNAAHVISATATTAWGTSLAARLALTVNTSLNYNPVGLTLSQRQSVQHPRDASGCVDPARSLQVTLWPNEPVTISVPARVLTATAFVEVNSVRSDLLDPDADGVFTGVFTAPATSGYVILLAVDVGGTTQTLQIGATIDPEGYVYDALLTASTGVTRTVAGVTVTLYVSDTVRLRWVPWDAPLYSQITPQITSADGHFSFFTPPGTYKLVVDGEGLSYQLYESPSLVVVAEPIRRDVPLWLSNLQSVYLPLLRKP